MSNSPGMLHRSPAGTPSSPFFAECRPASGRPPVRNLVDPYIFCSHLSGLNFALGASYEFEPTFFGQAAGALVVLVMGVVLEVDPLAERIFHVSRGTRHGGRRGAHCVLLFLYALYIASIPFRVSTILKLAQQRNRSLSRRSIISLTHFARCPLSPLPPA